MKKLWLMISLCSIASLYTQVIEEQTTIDCQRQETEEDDFYTECDIYRTIPASEEEPEFKAPPAFVVFWQKIGVAFMLRFFAAKDWCFESYKTSIVRLKEFYARKS